MRAITLRPHGFVTTTYDVINEGGQHVTQVMCPFWPGRLIGEFSLDDMPIQIRFEGLLRREFKLKIGDEITATALYHTGFLGTVLDIEMADRNLTVRKAVIGEYAELIEGEQVLGTFRRKFGFVSSPLCAEIDDEIPLAESIFICIITIRLITGDIHFANLRKRRIDQT